MIIRSVNLETVCGVTSKLPHNTKPEVAFAGKSNVGKSSLINAIMNRKSYARTSQSPGKTQTINYYNINDEFYLVDLPGYGYAKAGKELVAGWGKLIEDYLYQSKVLKSVFLLIDIRHEPSENDRLMYDWVRSRGYEPVIIATKADKIKRSQLAKQTALIRKTLGMPEESLLFPFSALSKQGRDEVVEYIESLINE
ncbi:MAG: ribosome biogenesis GTP-binding protein YihA/YsxC [Lachnospiraceae bacterium]|nr:ribosome biogenesis GTP-binding protein YihA/YsxC [Lachnospiraceae bacterium]